MDTKTHSNFLYLTLCIILINILSLSMHALILQYFPAPALNIDSGLDLIIDFAIKFCIISGSIFIYYLSKEYWVSTKLIPASVLFAMLLMALTGSLFRSTFMNVLVGNSWHYQVLLAIPTYLRYVILSILINLFAITVAKERLDQLLPYILLAIIATFLFIAVGNITTRLLTSLIAHAPNLESAGIQPPYGLNILIPSYLTHLEPTIAAFIVFYLIKNKLSVFNTLAKGLILGGIIAIIHAGLYSIIQIVYSEGNLLYRILYYGQFLWEYFTLGILTAYSFKLTKLNYTS